MKDYLLDLIQHTYGLGVIELVKVTGTPDQTTISAYAEDRSVVINGTFNDVISGFEGVFGMPNLAKLKTILSFDEYDASAKITVIHDKRDNEKVPTTIHFETSTGDFINDYRLMSKTIIEDKVKNVSFKGAAWNVEFEPSVVSIARLKKQAAANSEELTFTTKTDNGDLKIYFGEPSTHSGNFVFHSGINGTLSKVWHWPVKVFLAIMDLPGSKIVKISDQGATEITVDSGLAQYKFVLPAHSK